MPDETPDPSPALVPPAPPQIQSGPTIRIGDEFGTAKRNLPPAKVVLLAIGGILIIVGLVAFLQRAKPQGDGSLDDVAAVELPGQGATLVALTFNLRNSGEKPIWVHDIQGKLVTASGEQNSDAVSATDFDRYYQAFPMLKRGAMPPLIPEDKLPPGQQTQRTIIVSFPVTLENFNQRRSVSAVIQPYDQPLPIVLTK
jgi:hypothetical protein